MFKKAGTGSSLRLAVIASPRSGNMWLRRLLVTLYGLEERSAHTPGEVGWETLPDRCALQIHWRPERPFRRRLRASGFRTVVLVRHPLDALLSILHFAGHEPQTARWLDAEEGDESAIIGSEPTSEAFLAYATGPRARALLSVSPGWWARADFAVRYEELVASPERELARLAAALGVPTAVSPAEAVEQVTFARLAREASNTHFWQGRAGHWRELLPAEEARAIARAHDELLVRFGYAVDPDPALTREVARARWLERATPVGAGA
ncbi:MAG TPA: hypothetical protein VHC67_02845 [Gaiellaceae bacterium]|nr:hypothetical protein [Gaiellaceae bacterium]